MGLCDLHMDFRILFILPAMHLQSLTSEFTSGVLSYTSHSCTIYRKHVGLVIMFFLGKLSDSQIAPIGIKHYNCIMHQPVT